MAKSNADIPEGVDVSPQGVEDFASKSEEENILKIDFELKNIKLEKVKIDRDESSQRVVIKW